MNPYTIGLIIEGIVALALIVAIIVVAAKKREPVKQKNSPPNGIAGYLEAGNTDKEEPIFLTDSASQTSAEEQTVQQPAYSENYAYAEQQEYVQQTAQPAYSENNAYAEQQEYAQQPVQPAYSENNSYAEQQEYAQQPVQPAYSENYAYAEQQGYVQQPAQPACSENYAYAEQQEYVQQPAQPAYSENYAYAEQQGYAQSPVREEAAQSAEEARGFARFSLDNGEDGEGFVRFRPTERSFEEAFTELGEEQKRYFSEILAYALSKPKAEDKVTKNAVCVRSNKKLILKLKIRRKITVAAFKLENDLLRDYRRNIGDASSIRLKETEIYVSDESAKETAFGMIDLMLEQYEREREEAQERRRLARAARRAELAAEQSAQEEEDAPSEDAFQATNDKSKI